MAKSAISINICNEQVSNWQMRLILGLSFTTYDCLKIAAIVRILNTDNFVPGYLGIMVTRQVQFCCIFAVTKDKFDYF